MKKKKLFKCLVVVLLICVTLFSACSNTFAKVNEDYGGETSYVSEDVEEKLLASVLIDALGSFLYGMSSWIESIVQSLFKGITGVDMFPWADKIIFNAIPILDVNFLNPSDNTLFLNAGKETALATIVRNTYYTIFAIVVGFLSVLVAAMAIKLAISTIAAEKAQYKKAITRWVFTMVMLFVMHFAMSLVFYVNEQIVRVASSIAKDAFEKVPEGSLVLEALTEEEKKQVIDEYCKRVGFDDTESINQLKSPEKLNIAWLLTRSSIFQDVYGKDSKGGAAAQLNSVVNKVINMQKDPAKLKYAKEEKEKYSKSLTDELMLQFYANNRGFCDIFTKEGVTIVSDSPGGGMKVENSEFFKKYIPLYLKMNDQLINFAENKNIANSTLKEVDLIYDMATFFKESAFTYKTSENGDIKGWKPSKVSISGAILYSIFIFQSLLYFYAYIKRFFYIIILAIMAPAIVVFDFFAKSMN